ncbi:TVP38/TMEM64 family protein [Clostridium sp. C8-1-8]|uniref:TVP38/TMEM64 family protein n=1 Tax=Clostridium sp. C8-1-8 TaxID=2698831 RepID=UPI00136BE8CE|nr:TVP38/TMEM64 family protein [Clostridium sp. C8-1-8]
MKEKLKKYKYHIIVGILLLIILAIFYKYYAKYIDVFTDVRKLKAKLISYGPYSWLAFLVMQIMQIVIFIIPGEIVQVAAGYIFGPWIGFALSLLGAVIGSAITFVISQKLGKPFVEKLVSDKDLWLLKKLDHYKAGHSEKNKADKSEKEKHKSLRRIVFLLYIIPGIPKDILGYICGITSLSLKEFLIISNIARTPMLFVSIFFGHNLSRKKIVLLVAIIGVVCILVLIGVLVGKKIINKDEKES